MKTFILFIFAENIFLMNKQDTFDPILRKQRELFGLRMQQIRYEKKIKMDTLHIYTKLGENELYKVERGTVSVSLNSMTKIFKVFGITFDEFFHTEDFQKEIK